MNEALYDAVFSYGENKIDPFAQCCVDFDRIISDMRLVGYEINSLNIVQQIMLEQLDKLQHFISCNYVIATSIKKILSDCSHIHKHLLTTSIQTGNQDALS